MNNIKYGLFGQHQSPITAEQVKDLWNAGFKSFINSSPTQPTTEQETAQPEDPAVAYDRAMQVVGGAA